MVTLTAHSAGTAEAAAAAPATGSHPAPGRWLALGLGAVVLVVLTGALLLDLENSPADRTAAHLGWGTYAAVVGAVVTATGAVILRRHPRHLLGWILASTGVVWALDGLCESYTSYGIAASPDLPLTGFALWFVAQFGAVLLLCLPSVLVLYPTGRVMAGRWGRVSIAVLVMAAALPLALMFAPDTALDADDTFVFPRDTGMPELPISPEAFEVVLRVSQLMTFSSVLVAVAVVVVRQRRAVDRERVQMRWLAWAAIVCALVGVFSVVVGTGGWLLSVTLVLALTVTGVSVAIGILDPEITDVDALMGGTLVYAVVAGAVVLLDVLLIAILGATLGDRLAERDVTLLVLLVAIAAYGPLRVWLGGLVRRLLVGRRGDRYGVVAGLAARLEESSDVHQQLPALAATVATTFKLGFVQVEVFGHGGGTLTASYGSEPDAVRDVPIRYGTEQVGRLVLPDRGLRSMLSRRDQELLFDVVRQAAMAVRSARLARELQASRERLVLDREDDRRRIRRDLHDGLGPVLGGVAMRLDAVGNALEDDPVAARRMVAQSRQDITDALADVRRLVHGLRPPALDDLGLVAAIDQQVERMRSDGLDIRVQAEALPALPAAVEVAAYRIVSEALANMSRHAGARSCTVGLWGESGALRVEVRDDGVGIAPDVVAGVGLGSMRDRAAELGGAATVTCPDEGGTLVEAWLPFSDDDEREIR